MTPQEARERVAAIEAVKEDPEQAHFKEDRLWEDALNWIALGGEDAAEIANEVLKTADIEFSRWFA